MGPEWRVWLGGWKGGSQYRAVGGEGVGVAAAAFFGDRDVDAAAVEVAEAAFDQAMLLQAADEPGQSALAQVHGVGQLLDAELVVRALGQAFQYLEVADAQAVTFAEFAL